MGINLGLTRGSVVLQQGGVGTWDADKVGPMSIAKLGAQDYIGVYEGIVFSSLTQIGLLTSTDGTNLTKYGSNPVLTPTQAWMNDEISVGTLIWDPWAQKLKLWGHGGGNTGPRQIFYAESTDRGQTWTLGNSGNPVISNGGVGTWNENRVHDISVVQLSPTDYRAWLVGVSAGGVQAIGYYTSSDGISWSPYGSNPVFGTGSAGQWDDGTVYGLKVVKRACDRSGFHGWYAADDGTLADATATGIGYAANPSGDGATWIRGRNNPVLVGTLSPEEWISDPIEAFEDPVNQTMRVYFYYDDFSASPTERSHREATVDLKPSILTLARSLRTGTEDPYTFNVTPQGLPCGIVVTAVHGASSTDHIVGITYGGVSLARVQTNVDTVTEPGRADIWFLGTGIPTGTQTVSIDLASATTDDIQFCCFVLYASGDMECIATGGVDNDVANPSVTLAYRGKTAMAFGALYGGGAAPSSFTPNGNCVTLFEDDLGAFYAEVISQQSPGSADFAIGGTSALDDVAFAAAAFAARTSDLPLPERRRSRRSTLLRM